jgi:DNA-binding MurR/RpiR family transcriptional regulator
MMINGGLTIIRTTLESLRPSEKKVAKYILQEPHVAVNSTIAELAKNSQTSEAAVVRLCKTLEIKGFQELKLRIAGDLLQSQPEEYRDIMPDEPIQDIINKVSYNNMQAIRETIDVINHEEIEKAAEKIKLAENVIFYGVGASAIIAQDAQQKFLRINKNATSVSDFHLAAVAAVNAGPQDVVMGISYTGETMEVVEVLELAKKNGATTISLTKYGKSPVSEQADIHLFTSASIESSFRSAATSSRIAQLNVIDILFIFVASRMYEKTIEYLERTRKAVQGRKVKR